jgi:exopolysaccharide biosynthesis polyprenyl glycosylphosphotransferase
MTGSYSGDVLLKRTEAVARGTGALLIAASVTAMVLFFLQAGSYFSRLHFGVGLTLTAMFLPVARCLFVRYASRRLDNALHSVVELRDGLRSTCHGQVPTFDTSKFFDPVDPTPESLDRLAQLIANVDRVVVSCPESKRGAWAHVLQGMNVHGEIIIPLSGDIHPLGVESFHGRTTLLVGRGPLTLRERASKRLFDVTIALGALLVLWPVMLLVAIAIKLESPGPVIFKQARIGRQNRLFHVRKFRSMHLAACDGAGHVSTARGDSRVTRIGRFIRRTSIDELPQLFNVLVGEMSIVGPRPHAVSSTAEDRLFWEIDSRYWHRHACKPGLTGLAQVRGFRGSTNCVQDITDRLMSDLEDLAGWSLWRDVAIVIRTARVVLHQNAY